MRVPASLVISFLCACGGSVTTDELPSSPLGGDPAGGADPTSRGDGRGDSTTGDPGSGDPPPDGDSGQCLPSAAVPYCRVTCVRDADCVVGTPNPAHRQRCTDGVCTYAGCATHDDCTSGIGAGYACVLLPCATTKSCMRTCNRPSDCATASAPFDADNYACTDGMCEYLGCHSDAECAASSADLLCADPQGLAFRACYPGCESTSDCGYPTALYDSAHYDCRDNACVWRGCASTSECRAAYGATYVCR